MQPFHVLAHPPEPTVPGLDPAGVSCHSLPGCLALDGRGLAPRAIVAASGAYAGSWMGTSAEQPGLETGTPMWAVA